MFKHTGRIAVVLIGLSGIAAAPQANAAIFDFMAAGNALEKGYKPYTLTIDGIGLTARGYNGATEVFAYLDGGNAGMGVCKILSRTQCNPSNDDNVTGGERLNLTFNTVVTLNEILFRNDRHTTSFPGFAFVSIGVDSGPTSAVLIANGGVFSTPLTGQSFDFAYNNQQFYIGGLTGVAAVPEPASLMLLGVSMLGMSLVRRREA